MLRNRTLWSVFLLVSIWFSFVFQKPSYSRPPSPSNEVDRDGVYVAYANGIVEDTKTCLEWKIGPDKDTDWNEANSWVQNLNLDGGGWRLPTMDELEDLYRRGTGGRNVTPFSKTSEHYVWSGEKEDSNGGVWLFEFFSGKRDWLYPNSGRFFRHSDRRSYSGRAFAVRSQQESQNRRTEVAGLSKKPPDSRFSSKQNMTERHGTFEIYANGIIKDTKSGLEWKEGPDKDTNWNEARSWVQGLDLDGGGWRMPAMDELENLYRKGAGDVRMTLLLKTDGHYVWSGETEDSHGGAWLFEFFSGRRDWLYPGSSRFFRHSDRRSYSGRALAVRTRSDR